MTKASLSAAPIRVDRARFMAWSQGIIMQRDVRGLVAVSTADEKAFKAARKALDKGETIYLMQGDRLVTKVALQGESYVEEKVNRKDRAEYASKMAVFYASQASAALGAPIVLEPSQDLQQYRKGKPLLLQELRKLPDGAVVFCLCKEREYDGRTVHQVTKANGATRVKKIGPDYWSLDDGSSFGGEINLGGFPEDGLCRDDYEEGYIQLFRVTAKKKG